MIYFGEVNGRNAWSELTGGRGAGRCEERDGRVVVERQQERTWEYHGKDGGFCGFAMI